MTHRDVVAALDKMRRSGLGNHDASVLATGATDGYGKMLLALGHIPGHRHIEQVEPRRGESARLLTAKHEVAHELVVAVSSAIVGS